MLDEPLDTNEPMGSDGNDLLIGGTGADTFIWSDGDTGIDHISDFSIAEGDQLDLSELLHVETGHELNEYLELSSNGIDTTISIHAVGDNPDGTSSAVTQTIVLDGVGSDDVTVINDLFANNDSGPLIIVDDSSTLDFTTLTVAIEDDSST